MTGLFHTKGEGQATMEYIVHCLSARCHRLRGVAGRRRVAMRLPCNTFYNFMLFTNYVCICFHVIAK